MKKILLASGIFISTSIFADPTGIYIGGGLGYGSQQTNYLGSSNTDGTPALRAQFGYQFANWLDAELGWNYLTQGSNWNNLGTPSTTIYDFAFLPDSRFLQRQ